VSYITRNLPPIKTFTSSGGAAVTVPTALLDDASSITLFFTSSFSGTSSAGIIQASQWDPFDPTTTGVMTSTMWGNLASVTSSAAAQTLSNISFKSLRVSFTATSSANGEILAYVVKQITV
jgi:hypothetical protein